MCHSAFLPHTHTSDTSLSSLFPETVFSVFIIRLFPLLECPPPPMLVDIFLLLLQGPGKTQRVLRSPLRSILLWLISFQHAPQHCVSNFSISECSLYWDDLWVSISTMNSWEAGDMSYPSLHPVVVLNIVMKHGLEFSPIWKDAWSRSWDTLTLCAINCYSITGRSRRTGRGALVLTGARVTL